MTEKTNPLIRIMIVDDHKMLAESLGHLINSQSDMQIVAQASSGKEALKFLEVGHLEINLILLDLQMDETDSMEPDGIRTARYILKNLYIKGFREIKILVVTQFMEGYLIDIAHKLGAHGYISKDCDSYELFRAIRAIALDNRRYYRGEIAAAWDRFVYKFSGRQDLPSLTPTENEILQYIADGLTTKEIADKRGRGVDGIEAHRRNLMRKFNARNAPHLIALAYNLGFIKKASM